jgi:SprT protein
LPELLPATGLKKAGTTAAVRSARVSRPVITLFRRMDKINSVLQRYLPPGTSETFTGWICNYRIHLHITRNRSSKAGDYRSPLPKDPRHRISINHNLNPYAFLITLAHELAHRVVFEKYNKRVKPHGKEWKLEFQKFMISFLTGNTFPDDLRPVVIAYMRNVSASSSTDMALSRALRKYDPVNSKNLILVEELEEGTLFRLGNKRVFKKGPLIRKRYQCECISNRRIYLVNGNAEVSPVN